MRPNTFALFGHFFMPYRTNNFESCGQIALWVLSQAKKRGSSRLAGYAKFKLIKLPFTWKKGDEATMVAFKGRPLIVGSSRLHGGSEIFLSVQDLFTGKPRGACRSILAFRGEGGLRP